ncbi:MAG: HesA/MoeB/ThiF family protein [Candidatus Binatia bacterium]
MPKIEKAKVLVVGVGGLGSAAAMTLARAGVGAIGLADPDRVELSNLHRQLLHGTADIGQPKVASAARKLAGEVHAHPVAVTAESAPRLFAAYDFVIDATDRPAAKYLLNDEAVRSGRPLSHAGVVGFAGQLFTIVPGRGACLRCVFPSPPDEADAIGCREAGILGPLAAVLGALQAHEAIRVLGGRGEPLVDRLLAFDARTLRFREIRLRRDAHCVACSSVAASPATAAAC